jgi:hypothetical protein
MKLRKYCGFLSVLVSYQKIAQKTIKLFTYSKQSCFLPPEKSFSLYYNDLARKFFIALAGAGGLSALLFGIPLITAYLSTQTTNILYLIFSVLSFLGCIWGVMAYREFTISAERVMRTRNLAEKIDPGIGNHDYRSYNPETREFEEGYVPLGPIDFWDKETYAPTWLDKGKYWHILLGLQIPDKEIVVQVSRDSDLPLDRGRKNVAVTMKESVPLASSVSSRKRFRYRVKIPQWVVMNTDNKQIHREAGLPNTEMQSTIAELNRQIVSVADEIVEREKPRIKYPWMITGLGVYLNKSLPLRIIYKSIISKLPKFGKSIIEEANESLADIKEEKLVMAICQLASKKRIRPDRLDSIRALIKYLSYAYSIQGLGEGSTKYHNFHHSLEVTFLALQMLPPEFHGYRFSPHEIEMLIVAGLLHDYDPSQLRSVNNSEITNEPTAPKVSRTLEELRRTRIHDAYFILNALEFERFFPAGSVLTSSDSMSLPEFPAPSERPYESLVVEAIIWRTDFPYFRQKNAQEMFAKILAELKSRGQDTNKIALLGEILWLEDLSVTYMGSDPVRAWNRVTSLYDELYLPKLEAVSRTDSFFSDFADTRLFQELISSKSFPDIFKHRWNLVYQFFHEGNPSTSLNRTVEKAHRMFLKVNMEIGMLRGRTIHYIAAHNWAEYFVAIGKNQEEVTKTKSAIVGLEPQNASAFWGEPKKLIPHISNGSIDNFLLRMPMKNYPLGSLQDKLSLKSLLETLPAKLRFDGTLQILTDLPADEAAFKELSSIVRDLGFRECESDSNYKVYFPTQWTDEDFSEQKKPRVVLYCLQRRKKNQR